MSATLLAIALLLEPVSAGELWLEATTDNHDGQLRVELPANWLAEAGEPVEVTVEGQRYDLREVARAAKARREGTRIQLRATDEQGHPCDLALEHRRSRPGGDTEPQKLTLELLGDDGELLELHLPLLLGQGAMSIVGDGYEANIQLEGLEIPWEAQDFLAQLRAAPPTALVMLEGHDGGRVSIRTE
jgi:hypothetical protein